MAVIDPQQDAVVIRVVYDGPPLAGKTTSVRALARGLGGQVTAPEELNGRTLYFDWLDYTGGLFEGRRIRCQVISVPGQATLASRRRHLLESADVVVFVGDSAAENQSAVKSYLEGLSSVLARVDGPPVGIVLQANKRDVANAVSLDVMRTILNKLGGRIAILESIAIDGSGVREAFVFAVRLALDRVRELMRTNQLRVTRPSIDSAQELLAELRNEEGDALNLASESGLNHTPLHQVRTPSMAVQALESAVRDNVPDWRSPWSEPGMAGGQAATPGVDPTAPAHNGAEVRPLTPTADLPSGMIWPPVNGRLILHEATAKPILLYRLPSGDWTGAAEVQWHLHSPTGARFDALESGRHALVNWARMHAASAHVISGDRCVLLCKDGGGFFRLWQIVHIERSLRDEFNLALREGPAVIAKNLLTLTRAFLLAAERFSSAACSLPLSLRNVGAVGGGACYLGPMPDPQRARPATVRTQAAALKLLTVQLEYARPDMEASRHCVLAELDKMIGVESGASLDPTHAFARRFLGS